MGRKCFLFRFGCALIFAVFLFVSCFIALAVEIAALNIEHVSIVMPEIVVRFRLDAGGMSAISVSAEDLSATLDGKPLTVESVGSFDEGTLYLFLADASGSITPDQNEAMKQSLLNFRSDLRSDDRMALVAFGDDVTILLHGSESDGEAEDAIGSLSRTDQTTHFYDAISVALSIANNKVEGIPERCVVFVISDGLDETEGGGHTVREIEDRLRQDGLQLWALGLARDRVTGAQKDALDTFGELARNSGGGYATVTVDTLDAEMKAFYDYLEDTQVAYLVGDDNIADRREQVLELMVSHNGAIITSQVSVTPTSWIPDTEPPFVVGAPAQSGDYTIQVTFSELLSGADIIDNYIVTDAEGSAIPLLSIDYDPASNTGVITFDGQPYSGDYVLRFSGITDVSMELNRLDGEFPFYFDGKPLPQEPQEPETPQEPPEVPRTLLVIVFEDYWWVVLFFALVVAALVILLIIFKTLKKRRGLVKVDGKISFGDAVEFKHHFETPESKRASLVVTDMSGSAKRIDLDIYGSFFVGRSEKLNNLSFDDEKMSRQHFVIEAGEDGFFLADLNSTNGTHLNGVLVNGKRKLSDNDVITAGHEKFVFEGGA